MKITFVALYLFLLLLNAVLITCGSSIISFPIIKKHHTFALHHEQPTLDKRTQRHLIRLNIPQKTITQNTTKYGGYDIPMFANSVEYYSYITVGKPAQTLAVQLDTGSSLLAIPAKGCSSCSHTNPLYDPDSSQTSHKSVCGSNLCSGSNHCFKNNYCLFNISYGDNSNIAGGIVTDVVSFNGSNLPDVTLSFGLILQEYPSNDFQKTPVDGILGLAYGTKRMSCLPTCVQPLMEALVAQNNVPNLFAMGLEPPYNSYGGGDGGLFTIGGYELPTPSNANNNATIYYTPIIEEAYYVVEMTDLLLGGGNDDINNKNKNNSNGDDQDTSVSVWVNRDNFGATVVDSGTTYIILPTSLFQSLQQSFQSRYSNLPGITGVYTIFQQGICLSAAAVPSSVIKQFPNITFTLRGLKTVLSPEFYMVKTLDRVGNLYYCLGIVDGGENSLTILGDTFMQAFYIIFDRENKRIGFVGQTGTLQPFTEKTPHHLPVMTIIACSLAAFFTLVAIAFLILSRKLFRSRSNLRVNNDEVEQEEQHLLKSTQDDFDEQ